MVKINLLPWREERRQQVTNEFYAMLVAGIVVALLIAGLAYYYFDQSIKFQNKRNQYMTAEIAKLDKQIAEIKELEAKKASLISRQQVIEELQANRTQMVHLFDELVKTIPNGVFLEKINCSSMGKFLISRCWISSMANNTIISRGSRFFGNLQNFLHHSRFFCSNMFQLEMA